MGSKYLVDLADVCRRTGYPVIEVGGSPGQQGTQWKQRARGSGGYDSGKPTHIMIHHTASGPGSDGWGDVNYCIFSHQDRPLMNLYVSRVPEIYVCAAGATNTNGSGHDPCGVTPDDSMNREAIGIEAGNNGVGERWPDAMLDCYAALCKVLCDNYGIPYNRVHGHVEWAPTRKIDPAGPDRYAQGGATWNLNAFRDDVAGGTTPQPKPPEPKPPDPKPPTTTDWWTPLMQQLPVLRKGASGPPVKRMQHLLAAVGYMDPANTANYDGQFGSGTENALKKFQGAAGGSQDGVCGPWTWGALMHTIDGIPDLKKGAKGDDVKRMQHLLAANGFMNEANTSNYDGAWGNGTDSAKQNFDHAKGLTPSPPTDCGQGSWTRLLKG